jgi:hypothetical protein
MEILSISIDGHQSYLQENARAILPFLGCCKNRSLHAYHNSTTFIPGYRRILLGVSHLTQLNTS